MNLSNNISKHFDKQIIPILVDGEYFRLNVEKQSVAGVEKISYQILTDKGGIVCFAQLKLVDNEKRKFKYKTIKGPVKYFYLDTIHASSGKHKGFGTVLMDYIIDDISKYNKQQKEQNDLYFARLNTEKTIPFYKKWKAEYVKPADAFGDDYQAVTDMVIRNPQPIYSYEVVRLDDALTN